MHEKYCLSIKPIFCYFVASINPGTPQGTPTEKKTSILGTISGGKFKKRSGLLGIFGQNKVKIYFQFTQLKILNANTLNFSAFNFSLVSLVN